MSIFSDAFGIGVAGDAADAQTSAIGRARYQIQQGNNTAREDLRPFLEFGRAEMGELSRLNDRALALTGNRGQKLSVKYSGRALVQTPYMWQERIWDAPEYMRLHNLSLDNSQNTWPRYTDEQISAYESGPSAENPWFNYEDAYIKNITASVNFAQFIIVYS